MVDTTKDNYIPKNWIDKAEPSNQPSKSLPDNEGGASSDDEASKASDTLRPSAEWLEAQLFSKVNEETKLYAIIDGQWCKDILGRLKTYQDEIEWTGLIAGEQAQELALTSPYLMRLEKGHKLTHWLLEEGWGQGWGIFFHADVAALEAYRKPPAEPHKNQLARGAFVEAPSIEADTAGDVKLLRRHFRKFLRVEFEDDGRLVRFRFFDPAVLRIYLLGCNDKEIDAFFGTAIQRFTFEEYCEEESLNQPHRIWIAIKLQNQPFALFRYNYDANTHVKHERMEAAKGEPSRNYIGLVPLIRHDQIKLFEKMQMEILSKRIHAHLQNTKFKNINNKNIYDVVIICSELGILYGEDIYNCVVCALFYQNIYIEILQKYQKKIKSNQELKERIITNCRHFSKKIFKRMEK